IPGVADLHAPGALAASGIRVKPRRADLLGQQASAAAVERALRAALGGLPVGRIVEGERQAEVVLRVAADGVLDPERLARLPIAGGHGRVLPLGAVADVEGASLRTAITHEDGVRTVLVRLDARGRSLEAVALDVARAVAAAPLPAGVYAEVGGEYAAAAAARARLVGLGALALLGIFVLLVVDFGSTRLATLTMVNVPLAFVGGLAAVLLGAGGRLSLGAIVGFVTVFGITIRNGIVLVAHFRHVEEARGGPLDRGAGGAAAMRRAVIFDVENSSRLEHVARMLEHLGLGTLDHQTRLMAVGNWGVIGYETARLLARHGAELVHTAPAFGVKDWSDLRIAVTAGIWLAGARPGDLLDIITDDQAFDAVGDVASGRGVDFHRLSYRALVGSRQIA